MGKDSPSNRERQGSHSLWHLFLSSPSSLRQEITSTERHHPGLSWTLTHKGCLYTLLSCEAPTPIPANPLEAPAHGDGQPVISHNFSFTLSFQQVTPTHLFGLPEHSLTLYRWCQHTHLIHKPMESGAQSCIWGSFSARKRGSMREAERG